MINERLKSIRQALGVSQQAFSNAIGLEQWSYSGIESGRKGSLTKQTAMLLELVYNINMDFLYTGKGPMLKENVNENKTSPINSDGDSKTIEMERKIKRLESSIDALIEKNERLEAELSEYKAKEVQSKGVA